MFGLNADDDSRPGITGDVDAYIQAANSVSDNRDVFYSQVAAGLEGFQ